MHTELTVHTADALDPVFHVEKCIHFFFFFFGKNTMGLCGYWKSRFQLCPPASLLTSPSLSLYCDLNVLSLKMHMLKPDFLRGVSGGSL